MAYDIPDNCRLVFDQAQLQAALQKLAAGLNQRLAGSEVTVLCVMNGGLIFSGQLLPLLTCDCIIDYCHATRYRNRTEGADLHWLAEPQTSLSGKTVLVLDDILDEGNTLKAVMEYCRGNGATAVLSAVLLDKKHDRRINNLKADYVALVVEDEYVFGFGMDYEGRYRNLPAVYAVDSNS